MKKLIKGASVTAGSKYKRIATLTEFDNGHVLHNWTEMSNDEAEQLACKKSIENPNTIFYVSYDNVMDPCSDTRWFNGTAYHYSDVVYKNGKPTIKESSLNAVNASTSNALKAVGRSWSAFIDNVKSQLGYEVDSADRSHPSEYILLYKDNNTYEGQVTRYSDRSYELMDYNITKVE